MRATNVELDINLNEPIFNDPSSCSPSKFPPTTNVKSTCRISRAQRRPRPISPCLAEAQPKSVTTDPEPEPIPNGLQGPATVDASQLSKPLPEKQIYTAPVESGAGIVPFPTTTVVAAADPPQPAQNAPVQSYRVVPEIPQSRQDAVQPIATTSAFMNDQQVPQASAQQPLAPQENIAPHLPAQTPADASTRRILLSATSEPLGAPSANHGVSNLLRPQTLQYQQIQPAPQDPNRAKSARLPRLRRKKPPRKPTRPRVGRRGQPSKSQRRSSSFPAPSTRPTIEIQRLNRRPSDRRSPKRRRSDLQRPNTRPRSTAKTSWNYDVRQSKTLRSPTISNASGFYL